MGIIWSRLQWHNSKLVPNLSSLCPSAMFKSDVVREVSSDLVVRVQGLTVY